MKKIDPITKHIVDTYNKYEDGPEIKLEDPNYAENNKIKSNTQPRTGPTNTKPNTNPKPILSEYEKQILRFSDPKANGTFQKLVKADEKAYKDLQLKQEKKDEFGYTPTQNKQIEAYLVRDKSKPFTVTKKADPNYKARMAILDERIKNAALSLGKELVASSTLGPELEALRREVFKKRDTGNDDTAGLAGLLGGVKNVK